MHTTDRLYQFILPKLRQNKRLRTSLKLCAIMLLFQIICLTTHDPFHLLHSYRVKRGRYITFDPLKVRAGQLMA